MRYELREHVPSADYWHSGGWATFDTTEQRQVGWDKRREAGEAWVKRLNEAESAHEKAAPIGAAGELVLCG